MLGLVLELNLGLGRLSRKVGSRPIAALYALHAGSFITLRFHFLGGTTSHLILKRVRAEVMVRVRVRLVIGFNLRFGLGLVWNSTDY